MAVKVIYFVHGTTTDNKEHKSTGWIPGELTEKGIQQSIDLKDQINFYIDKLVQLYKISTDETQVKNLISTFKVSYVLVEHVIKQQILNIKVDEIIKEINDLIDVCFDFSYTLGFNADSASKFPINPATPALVYPCFNK